MGAHFGRLPGWLLQGEIERGKEKWKCSLFKNLETRAIVHEDLGRKMHPSGTYDDPADVINMIDAMSKEDVHRVAAILVSSTAVTTQITSKVVLGVDNVTKEAHSMKTHLPFFHFLAIG